MKANQVQIGQVYIATVSGKLVKVKVNDHSFDGGWLVTNLSTGKAIRIKTAARLRESAAAYANRYLSRSERLAQYAKEQLETETQQIINRTGGVSNEPITINP